MKVTNELPIYQPPNMMNKNSHKNALTVSLVISEPQFKVPFSTSDIIHGAQQAECRTRG